MKQNLFSILFVSSFFFLFCFGDLVKVPLSHSIKRSPPCSPDHPLDRRQPDAGRPQPQNNDQQRRLISPLGGGSAGLGAVPSFNIPSSGSGLGSSIPGLGSGSSGSSIPSIPSIGSGSIPSIGSGSIPSFGSGSLPSFGSGSIPSIGSSGSLPSVGSGSIPGYGSGSGSGSGSRPSLPSSLSSESNTGSTLHSSSNNMITSRSNRNRASTSCSSYVIINTRGTGEIQGPSSAFTTINSQVMAAVPGGRVYNTVYLAGYTQDSSQATRDIVSQVNSGVSANPNQCYVLEGYSQGAAATVNALSSLNGAAQNAVKAVFLVGDPLHKAGLACNVDNMGGTSTRNVNGISAAFNFGSSSTGISPAWVDKTLDVCISGDGICDSTHGFGVNMQHLSYPTDGNTHKLGITFITAALTG